MGVFKSIASVFKHKDSDLFNIHHPEFKDAVEPAFKVDGIQYYRFKQEINMPWSRYMILQTLLHAVDLRMDPDMLAGFIQLMRKALNAPVSKGIDLTTIIKVVDAMESRTMQPFEMDTTYALATVIYFDETEDIYSFNKAHNEKKAAAWKEARMVDFFYTRPMGELLGLSNISPEDLRQYIIQQEEVLRDLNPTSVAPKS
jgi:hypothetical protein